FAVTNHSLIQELALLDSHVLDFEPDIVIVTIPSMGRLRSVEHLVERLSLGVGVPYEGLREVLAEAGLDADMQDGIPVPFAALRSLTEALGLNTRMPYTEAEARARDASLQITESTLEHIASLAAAAGAKPVLLALDNVIAPPDDEIPELDAA